MENFEGDWVPGCTVVVNACLICEISTTGACKKCGLRVCLRCYNSYHGPVQCNAAQGHDPGAEYTETPSFLRPVHHHPPTLRCLPLKKIHGNCEQETFTLALPNMNIELNTFLEEYLGGDVSNLILDMVAMEAHKELTARLNRQFKDRFEWCPHYWLVHRRPDVDTGSLKTTYLERMFQRFINRRHQNSYEFSSPRGIANFLRPYPHIGATELLPPLPRNY